MEKEAYLPSSGPYHFQQLYQSHLLWFKIFALTIRLMLVRDLIQEAGRVPRPQTAVQGSQAPFMRNQKDLTQYTKDTGLCGVRIKYHLCSAINKETGTKFRCL